MRRVPAIVALLLLFGIAPHARTQPPPEIALAETAAPDTARINWLTRQGRTILYQHPDSALQYFHEAIALDKKGTIASAAARGSAGVVHYIRGEYDLALPLFLESLRLYRETKDQAGLSTGYNRIGLIYQIQERYNEAIAYHRKGANHGHAAGKPGLQSAANFNIGLAYDETGAYDSALFYVALSLEQATTAGNEQMILMNLNRMAKIHFHKEEYDAALTLFDSVLNHPDYKSNWETCFALAGLAETYDAIGDYDKAIAAGLESLSVAREMDAKWDVVHVAEILAKTYANSGRYADAYAMALTTQAYKDSLFDEEKENRINYIQLKETELAKATLENENALQAVRLERRNIQMVLATVITVSLVCVVLALYSRQRQKNKLNRQLQAVNRQIARQNDDLRELNESKNQLLSIISHDMRSPIANLQSLLALMRQGHVTEDERKVLFEQLEHNFSAVSGTLENLLQWSRVQIEGSPPQPETVDLTDIVESVRGFWAPALRGKNIRFTFDGDDCQVRADPDQLETVVRNVVGNAVKYTPPSGVITVDTRRENGHVGIVVRDSGIGIPESIRASLFEMRKQNQRPGTSREKGSGMGLMISQQLLQKNGGRIDVSSEEGEGTTFTLWLPAA